MALQAAGCIEFQRGRVKKQESSLSLKAIWKFKPNRPSRIMTCRRRNGWNVSQSSSVVSLALRWTEDVHDGRGRYSGGFRSAIKGGHVSWEAISI